ncbi:DUF1295 domain-containing protein [Paenibacillus sp. J5C_2022]|uniref:DUF1295 domain-containing protein n=1 Tax=Paenibacillus sp. J5C2022 TaxID=2977129 RepID=UPI0021CDFAF1|nr:DUF1295 domain-containing protein [Paenibacillus sp. J5C2022]MCU6707275.1 DUF1295 domain-containing protein [Paenibacillus sp. J5C2022]
MKTLYSQHNSYWYPRLTLMTLELIIMAIAAWLLFFDGHEVLNNLFHWKLTSGNPGRNTLLFIMIVIVFVRMKFTMFYLLRRPMPWQEALTVPAAFSLYYVVIPVLSLMHDKPLGGWDIGFAILFIIGSLFNSHAEWLRHVWKQDPANRGKLYTGGYFRYSMHINYFGDVLWVLAMALVAWNGWALLIPLWLFCFFAFFNIPMLDKHLAQKYGEPFEQYRKRTKTFVPFLY